MNSARGLTKRAIASIVVVKMKAVVFHGKEDIRVEDIEIPKCEKGKVKVLFLLPLR